MVKVVVLLGVCAVVAWDVMIPYLDKNSYFSRWYAGSNGPLSIMEHDTLWCVTQAGAAQMENTVNETHFLLHV